MLRERADPNLNNRVSQKTCTRGNAEVREANPAEAADPESGGHAAALCSHARGGPHSPIVPHDSQLGVTPT